MKKRLKRDLLRELDQKYWDQAIYNPSLRFNYRNVIIRSVDDTHWPNVDEAERGRISTWFKGEFWDFYENGIELVTMGGHAIFDKDGSWDILKWPEDNRESNEKYKKVYFTSFLRIPYEFIVDYDMDPDAYYCVPTIYVEYAKDGMPYEEILCGDIGYYDKEKRENSRLTYYYDNEKRKTLE
ncbi:MAG: hypothetical protein JWN78_2252 [Bacteroidota bacterium]|nr:hypothetical protein [Bacteroidota bacterium]